MRYLTRVGVAAGIFCLLQLVTACVSSSRPAPPPSNSTTIVVPPGSSVTCHDGTKPPCYDSNGKLLVCADGTKPPCH
jgi:hypothetical protein